MKTKPATINNHHYSTKNITSQLLNEISRELEGLDWGSLEVYVSNHTVTQISKRRIRKTITK